MGSYYQAVIFDLDDTLLLTKDLEPLREYFKLKDGWWSPEQVLAVIEEELFSKPRRLFYTAQDLTALREALPELLIGVLSSSPQLYVDRLLELAYPQFKFDFKLSAGALAADGRCTRDLSALMEKYKLTPARTLYVGDRRINLISAREAGCDFAFEYSLYKYRRNVYAAVRADIYGDEERLNQYLPEASVAGMQDLLPYAADPLSRLGASKLVCGLKNFKAESLRFYCTEKQLQADTPPWGYFYKFKIFSCGPYYPLTHSEDRGALGSDPYSTLIREFKHYDGKSGTINAAFIYMLGRFIADNAAGFKQVSLVELIPIPAHQGRPPRVEALAVAVKQWYDGLPEPKFKLQVTADALKFYDSGSVKRLGTLEERRQKAAALGLNRSGIRCSIPRGVVVLDDVTTSGATLL